MNLRPKLSYANVVATVALFLVVAGGSVYAAVNLGKNDVKSKNIAKGAVKTSDLAKNAVKSPKIKNGTIVDEDLASSLLNKLDAEVTVSASAGPQGGLNTNTENPLPLNGNTTFTPKAGEVSAITAEGKFTYASANPPQFCSPNVRILVNGQPTRVFVDPEADGNTATPVTATGRDADGPYGLVEPGTPLTLTATIEGDVDCTAATQLDKLEVRVVQIR